MVCSKLPNFSLKKVVFLWLKKWCCFQKMQERLQDSKSKAIYVRIVIIAKLPHWGWLWYVALIRASCVATQLVVPLVFVIAWEEVWKWLKFLNVFLEDYRLYATKLHNAWLEIWWFVASCSKFRLWRILLKETLPYVSCAVARQLTSK